ncbi:MAG: hypothetical protein ACK5BH_16240 [Bacteroidota bacterium]
MNDKSISFLFQIQIFLSFTTKSNEGRNDMGMGPISYAGIVKAVVYLYASGLKSCTKCGPCCPGFLIVSNGKKLELISTKS